MRRLTSTVRPDPAGGEGGWVEVALADMPEASPRDHEVVVRIGAAPVNPSDLIVMLAGADAAGLETDVAAGVLRGRLSAAALAQVADRFEVAVPVGNEGAGRVVAAGASPEAQALLGRVVAVLGGGTFADAVRVPAAVCLPFPDGTEPTEVAGAFVNPMTAIGMVDTMRREGHQAIVHTAAASSLGRMLVRLCRREGVPLVNVVRRAEQAAALRAAGAEYVCDSSAPGFDDELTDAIAATGATLAFDAVGGAMSGRLLVAMERAQRRGRTRVGPYGTDVHKQVYVYGFLDPGAVSVPREVGMAWGAGGWLLSAHMARVGVDGVARMRAEVAGSLHDVFATTYGGEIGLDRLVDAATVAALHRAATGDKHLVVPR